MVIDIGAVTSRAAMRFTNKYSLDRRDRLDQLAGSRRQQQTISSTR